MSVVKLAEGAKFRAEDTLECLCGIHTELGVYVAAHWHEALMRTCENCGTHSVIQRGVVTGLIKGDTA